MKCFYSRLIVKRTYFPYFLSCKMYIIKLKGCTKVQMKVKKTLFLTVKQLKISQCTIPLHWVACCIMKKAISVFRGNQLRSLRSTCLNSK